MLERHAVNKQAVIFYLECNGRQGALGFYRLFFGIASRLSADTRLCVIRQKS